MAVSICPPMKELFRLIRDVDKLTTGQAKVYMDEDNVGCDDENQNDDECLSFYTLIEPNDGPYKGGKCKFKISVTNEYPDDPPKVTCCNAIYHPNIDMPDDGHGGSVCVNLLDCDWQPEVGLDGCVMALLFLFYHPQIDDALNPAFSGRDMDFDEFEENVRHSMKGNEIDGLNFDNIIEPQEADEDGVDNSDGIDAAVNEAEKAENQEIQGKIEDNVDSNSPKETSTDTIEINNLENSDRTKSNNDSNTSNTGIEGATNNSLSPDAEDNDLLVSFGEEKKNNSNLDIKQPLSVQDDEKTDNDHDMGNTCISRLEINQCPSILERPLVSERNELEIFNAMDNDNVVTCSDESMELTNSPNSNENSNESIPTSYLPITDLQRNWRYSLRRFVKTKLNIFSRMFKWIKKNGTSSLLQ